MMQTNYKHKIINDLLTYKFWIVARGAAGILAMIFLVPPILMKIIIFGLSKDQTFRIWSTFKSPEQILILVTHLLL